MLLKFNVDLTSCDPGNSCYQACYSDEKKLPIMYVVFFIVGGCFPTRIQCRECPGNPKVLVASAGSPHW
jgi:hypothetical protein